MSPEELEDWSEIILICGSAKPLAFSVVILLGIAVIAIAWRCDWATENDALSSYQLDELTTRPQTDTTVAPLTSRDLRNSVPQLREGASSSAYASTGDLLVTVYGNGLDTSPIEGILIMAGPPLNKVLGETDSKGQLHRELPIASRVEIAIQEASVPELYALPEHQFRTSGNGIPPTKQSVSIVSNTLTRLTFSIDEARSVGGQVLRERTGEPVEGAQMTLSATGPGQESIEYSTISGRAGHFSFTRVLPLQYALRFRGSINGNPVDEILPPPTHLDLRLNSESGLLLYLKEGDRAVSGSIFDQYGEPLGKIDVLAFYCGKEVEFTGRPTWRDRAGFCRTDDSGSFRLEGLYSHKICIQIGAHASSNDFTPGQVSLIRWPDLIEVELAGIDGASVDLGTISVMRAKMSQVITAVVIASSARNDLDVGDMSVELHYVGNLEGIPLNNSGRRVVPIVDYNQHSGSLSIVSKMGSMPIAVKIRADQEVDVSREIIVYPVEGQSIELPPIVVP